MVTSSKKCYLGELVIQQAKSEIRPLSLIFTTINSKWMEGSISREMLRRTLGEALQNTGTGKNFVEKRLLTAQEVNPRVHRWDSMKLKGTGTLSTVRKQAADGRSLTALCQMGLMLRMYKECRN